MRRRRKWISGGLVGLALPFIVVVGASYGGAYRCPRGEECLGMVGAFLILGLPSIFIAAALLAAAIMIATRRSRSRIAAAAFVLAFAVAALLFSLVWFTPHPRA